MTLALICAGWIAWAPVADPAPPPDLARSYQEARAQAGRSPEAQVRLALWCESHGLTAERLHHLTLAVLADPKNAAARGLMGLVSRDGRWQRPEAVADKAKADATLSEYEAKRLKAAYTADAQWALGVWCDEHGLKEQAKAHLTAVIRLDPSRENAWKKLGYKKHEGRWATEAQLALEKADAEAQKGADRKWKPLLEKYKAMLDQPSRRGEAEVALANVTDPRAVPMIGRIFVTGRPTGQSRAVQLLGQVDSPSSSKLLAALAVFSGSPEVRRASTETLKGRDLREFAGLLIALLRDPIKYEVRPVGGPGSPGALFVEGERFNVRRLYSPPPATPVALGPSDWVGTDDYGLPVVHRYGGTRVELQSTNRIPADQLLAMIRADNLPNMPTYGLNPQFLAGLNNAGIGEMGATLAEIATRRQREQAANLGVNLAAEIKHVGRVEHKAPSQFGFGITQEYVAQFDYQIPVGQMMIEAQKTANFAQRQLESDVALVDAHNETIRQRNERVRPLLGALAGKDLGQDAKAWKAWWVDQLGYSYRTPVDPPKPTFDQDVPLAYQSQQPAISIQASSGIISGFTRISCFGAGTPVRTVDGVRPIESLKVGDLVLTQSTDSGGLGYKPILVVHHNPPSATFRIKVGGEPIISSHFHRFWVAGRGWVMARELKAGDPVRTLGGVSAVESVEADKVQLVYNLDVAEDADFFAGNVGALVHDNTLPDPRLTPFDAPSGSAGVAMAGRAE